MATEADISERISITEIGEEDKESICSQFESSLEELHKFEGRFNPPAKIVEYSTRAEHSEVDTNVEKELVNPVTEDDVGTSEGEIYLESPSLAKVTNRASDTCEAEEKMILIKEMSNNETQLQKDQISKAAEEMYSITDRDMVDASVKQVLLDKDLENERTEDEKPAKASELPSEEMNIEENVGEKLHSFPITPISVEPNLQEGHIERGKCEAMEENEQTYEELPHNKLDKLPALEKMEGEKLEESPKYLGMLPSFQNIDEIRKREEMLISNIDNVTIIETGLQKGESEELNHKVDKGNETQKEDEIPGLDFETISKKQASIEINPYNIDKVKAVSGTHKDETEGNRSGEDPELEIGEHIHHTIKATTDNNQEAVSLTSDLILESLKTDDGNVTKSSIKEVSIPIKQDVEEVNFQGVKCKEQELSNIEAMEKGLKTVGPSEKIGNEKQGEKNPQDNLRGSSVSKVTDNTKIPNDAKITKNVEATNGKLDIPSVTMVREETSLHKAEPEVGKLEEVSSTPLEEKIQETIDSSEMMKDENPVEDEIQKSDNLETPSVAQETIGTCLQEQEKPEKIKETSEMSSENIGKDSRKEVEPQKKILETISTTKSTISEEGNDIESPETKLDASPIKDDESVQRESEKLVLSLTEAPTEVNKDKEGSPVVEAKDNIEVTEIIEVRENNKRGTPKDEEVSNLELEEQVHEENGAAPEEKKQIEESVGMKKNIESTISEQEKTTDGAQTLVLISHTSETKDEIPEKACKLDSKDKSEGMDVTENMEEEMGKKDETSEVGMHKTGAESEDIEKRIIEEDGPISDHGSVSLENETVDQNCQVDEKDAAPELNSEDPNWKTNDINEATKNEIIEREVYEGPKTMGAGEDTGKQIIQEKGTVMDLSTESIREPVKKSCQEDEKEMKKNEDEIAEENSTIENHSTVPIEEKTLTENAEGHEVCERVETVGAGEETERQISEESGAVTNLSMVSIVEETVKDSSKEDEKEAEKLEEEVRDSDLGSISWNFEATGSIVETEIGNLKNEEDPNKTDAFCVIGASKEEMLEKESSTEFAVYEEQIKEEDLKKAKNTNKKFDAASARRLQEVEPEGEKLVDASDLASGEKSEATIETSWTSLQSLDVKGEGEQETKCKMPVEASDTVPGFEYQGVETTQTATGTVITAGKAPLDNETEENLQESSTLAPEEKEPESIEAREKIKDDTPMEDETEDENLKASLLTNTTRDISIKKEELRKLKEVPETGIEEIGKKSSNEELQKDDGVKLNKLSELYSEKQISESKDAPAILEMEKTTELVDPSKISESETTNDEEISQTSSKKENSDGAKPSDTVYTGPETIGACANTENDILDQDEDHIQNLGESSEQDRECAEKVQNMALKLEDRDQRHEINEGFDTTENGTLQEENLEDVDPGEKSERTYESMAEDQSHQTLPKNKQNSEGVKDQNSASVEDQMVMQHLQDEEKDSIMLVEKGQKLKAADHIGKTNNANETTKRVILNEEVKDSGFVSNERSTKETADDVKTETMNLNDVEDPNKQPEASPVTEPLEKVQKGGTDFVEVSNTESEVSEEKNKEEILEEADASYDKLDTASVIAITEETRLQEGDPEGEKLVEVFDIGYEEKGLGTVGTFTTSSQDEEFKKVKHDETSELVIQLPSECESTDEENLKVEKKDTDKVEEQIKRSSDTISESEDQGVEAVTEAETTAGWTPAAEESEEKLQEASASVSKQEIGRETMTKKITNEILIEDEILHEENPGTPTTETTEEMCLQKEEENKGTEQAFKKGFENIEKENVNEEMCLQKEPRELDQSSQMGFEDIVQEHPNEDAKSLLEREKTTILTEASENSKMETSKDEETLESDSQKEEAEDKKLERPFSEVCEDLDTVEKAAIGKDAPEKEAHVKNLEESLEEGKACKKNSLHDTIENGKSKEENLEAIHLSEKNDTPEVENRNRNTDDSPINRSLLEETLREVGGDCDAASNLDFKKNERAFNSGFEAQNHEVQTEIGKTELEEDGPSVKDQNTVSTGDEKKGENFKESRPALEAEEDRSEEPNETTKNEISKEEEAEGLDNADARETTEKQITSGEGAVNDPYLACIGEKTGKEVHQEDKMEGKKVEEGEIKLEAEDKSKASEAKKDKREKINEANETMECEILNEVVSEELENVSANETIEKQIAGGVEAVQDPYLACVGEETVKEAHQEEKMGEEGDTKLEVEEKSQAPEAKKDQREKINETETTKYEILNEKMSEELETVSASETIEKQITGGDKAVKDPYLACFGEITVKEAHQEDKIKEKNVEEGETKLEVEDKIPALEAKKDQREINEVNETIKCEILNKEVSEGLENAGATETVEKQITRGEGDVKDPYQACVGEDKMEEKKVEEEETKSEVDDKSHALEAKEDQTEKINEPNETMKCKILNEEVSDGHENAGKTIKKHITGEDGALRDPYLECVGDEIIKETHQEDKMEGKKVEEGDTRSESQELNAKDQREIINQTNETTKCEILNKEVSEELDNAGASETIEKQNIGREGVVKDPYLACVGEETVKEAYQEDKMEGKKIEGATKLEVKDKGQELEAKEDQQDKTNEAYETAKCEILNEELFAALEHEGANDNIEKQSTEGGVVKDPPLACIDEETAKEANQEDRMEVKKVKEGKTKLVAEDMCLALEAKEESREKLHEVNERTECEDSNKEAPVGLENAGASETIEKKIKGEEEVIKYPYLACTGEEIVRKDQQENKTEGETKLEVEDKSQALEVKEDEREKINDAYETTKCEILNEEVFEGQENVSASASIEERITKGERAVKDPYLASVGEETITEAHQEDKIEGKKVEEGATKLEVENKSQPLEAKEDQIEVSEGLENASASEIIEKQIKGEEEAIKDPCLACIGQDTVIKAQQENKTEGKKVDEGETKLEVEDKSQALEAKEDEREIINEANEIMKCEILNEEVSERLENAGASAAIEKQIKEGERAVKDTYVASVGEETNTEAHEEDKIEGKKVEEGASRLDVEGKSQALEAKEDQREKINEANETTNFEVSEGLDNAGASETIEKPIIGGEGAVKDPYLACVSEEKVKEAYQQNKMEGKKIDEGATELAVKEKSQELEAKEDQRENTNEANETTKCEILNEEVCAEIEHVGASDNIEKQVTEGEGAVKNHYIACIGEETAKEANQEDKMEGKKVEEGKTKLEAEDMSLALEAEEEPKEKLHEVNESIECENNEVSEGLENASASEIIEKQIKGEEKAIKDPYLACVGEETVIKAQQEYKTEGKKVEEGEIKLEVEDKSQALEAKEDEREKINDANETMKFEILNEEVFEGLENVNVSAAIEERITEGERAVKDPYLASVVEETITEAHQENKMEEKKVDEGATKLDVENKTQPFEAKEDQIEKLNEANETTKLEILNKEESEGLDNAGASETIEKPIIGEQGAVKDPYLACVGEEKVKEAYQEDKMEGNKIEEGMAKLVVKDKNQEIEAKEDQSGKTNEVNETTKCEILNEEVSAALEHAGASDNIEKRITEGGAVKDPYIACVGDETAKKANQEDKMEGKKVEKGKTKLEVEDMSLALEAKEELREKLHEANESTKCEVLNKEVSEGLENANASEIIEKQIKGEEKAIKDPYLACIGEETVIKAQQEYKTEGKKVEEGETKLEVEDKSWIKLEVEDKSQALEAKEDEREKINEAKEIMKCEILNEEVSKGLENAIARTAIEKHIKEGERALKDPYVASVGEETNTEAYEEDKIEEKKVEEGATRQEVEDKNQALEAKEDKIEKLNEANETTNFEILNKEGLDIDNADASETIVKQIIGGEGAAKDPYLACVGEETVQEAYQEDKIEGKTIVEGMTKLEVKDKSHEFEAKEDQREKTIEANETIKCEILNEESVEVFAALEHASENDNIEKKQIIEGEGPVKDAYFACVSEETTKKDNQEDKMEGKKVEEGKTKLEVEDMTIALEVKEEPREKLHEANESTQCEVLNKEVSEGLENASATEIIEKQIKGEEEAIKDPCLACIGEDTVIKAQQEYKTEGKKVDEGETKLEVEDKNQALESKEDEREIINEANEIMKCEILNEEVSEGLENAGASVAIEKQIKEGERAVKDTYVASVGEETNTEAYEEDKIEGKKFEEGATRLEVEDKSQALEAKEDQREKINVPNENTNFEILNKEVSEGLDIDNGGASETIEKQIIGGEGAVKDPYLACVGKETVQEAYQEDKIEGKKLEEGVNKLEVKDKSHDFEAKEDQREKTNEANETTKCEILNEESIKVFAALKHVGENDNIEKQIIEGEGAVKDPYLACVGEETTKEANQEDKMEGKKVEEGKTKLEVDNMSLAMEVKEEPREKIHEANESTECEALNKEVSEGLENASASEIIEKQIKGEEETIKDPYLACVDEETVIKAQQEYKTEGKKVEEGETKLEVEDMNQIKLEVEDTSQALEAKEDEREKINEANEIMKCEILNEEVSEGLENAGASAAIEKHIKEGERAVKDPYLESVAETNVETHEDDKIEEKKVEEGATRLEVEDKSQALEAKEDQREKLNETNEFELLNQVVSKGPENAGASEVTQKQITVGEGAVKDPYLACVGEEIVKEAHQEDKIEGKKVEEETTKLEVEDKEGKDDQKEKINEANETTKCEILNEEVSEGLENAEASDNISKQITEDKGAVKVLYLDFVGDETCREGHHENGEGKKVNEAAFKLDPEDQCQELMAEGNLRDKAHEITKCEILYEEVSMGFVNVSASEKTEKHITEEEVAGNDPYLISTEGGTIKENQKEEEMDGKSIEGEATKLDPEDQNHETNRKDDTTENYTIKEEEFETTASTDKIETVIIKDEGDPYKNLDASPNRNVPAEKVSEEEEGNEQRKISHIVPKELIHESIKTNEETKESTTEDKSVVKELIEVEKLKNATSDLAPNPSDITKDLHLKDQEPPTNNPNASTLTEASQDEVPEKGDQMTEDEKKNNLVFGKQATAEVILPTGEKEGEPIRDEAPIKEILKKECEKMKDDANIQETTCANEGKEIPVPEQEVMAVFLPVKQATTERSIRDGQKELDTTANLVIEEQSHVKAGLVSEVQIHGNERTQSTNLEDADSQNEKLQQSAKELSQKEGTVMFPEVTEIPRNIKLETVSNATHEEKNPRKADLIESTETNIPPEDKDTLSVPQDSNGKPLQKDGIEDQKPGEVLGIESEEKGVECGKKNKLKDVADETTEEAKSSGTNKFPLSDLQHRSTKETLHVVVGDINPPANNAEIKNKESQPIQVEEEKAEEEKKYEEEEDEHKKADGASDALVIVEASRDVDIKPTHKRSHNILSGVGSKVRHSIAKVKKAIACTSSHPMPLSPK